MSEGTHLWWAARGFGPGLLPVIPPNAALSPHSEVPADQRGKVPGMKGPWGWHSGPWMSWLRASEDRLQAWQASGAGVGFSGCTVPGLDVDVKEARVADSILAAVEIVTGFDTLRIRVGRVPRFMVPFRCAAAIAAWVWKWKDESGDTQMVDLRAAGRFWVADGVHAGTGLPYLWPAGRPERYEDLPLLTAELAQRLADVVREALLTLGIRATFSRGGGRDAQHGARDQAELLAPSVEMIEEALAVAGNDGTREGWIRMGHAIKAAGGTLEQWAAWSRKWGEEDDADLARRWAGFRAPFSVGWGVIEGAARAAGWMGGAEADFAAVSRGPQRGEEDEQDGGSEGSAEVVPHGQAVDALFRGYVYVEALDRFLDLDGTDPSGGRPLLTRLALSSRFPMLGAPTSQKNAAALFLATRGPRRRVAVTVDYRPRLPVLFQDEERGGALVGNLWTAAGIEGAEAVLGRTPTDEDVSPWLAAVDRLYTDQPVEKGLVLDWPAWVAQHEGEKPPFGLLLGGCEGIGKDSVLLPLLWAIGLGNVRTVTPEMLVSAQNDYLVGASLVVMPEVHTYARRETMDRIKPLLAAPPVRVSVNRKYVAQFEVRNICAVVMTTNHPDALALTRDSRRVAVCWSKHRSLAAMEEAEREALAAAFRDLHAWYEMDGPDGRPRWGLRLVASWLRARDVTAFARLGRAPVTEGMEQMVGETRGEVADAVAEWLEGWAGDLVSPADIAARVGAVGRKGRPVSAQAVGRALREAGAEPVTTEAVHVPPGCLVSGGNRTRLWALRNAESYWRMPTAALAREFAKQCGISDADIEKAMKPTEAVRNGGSEPESLL